MSELRTLNEPELEVLLKRALASRSSASLRVEGSVRMLGQLRVEELEPGSAIGLLGAKHRDYLPPAGTRVTLSLIMGAEAVTFRTVMLEPLEDPRNPPMLRTAWPNPAVEFHKREEVRVANPALPPLVATLIHQGQRVEAKLLNLTETGMGLGLASIATFLPFEQVEVETCLPGGTVFRAKGLVRHFEFLADDVMPTRLGLVLTMLPADIRDSLKSLIQARRMYYSKDIREG